MGEAYLMWIYDDGVRDALGSAEEWAEMEAAVGKAALKLCLRPDYWLNPRTMKMQRMPAHPVGNHGDCVYLCDEVHSSDEKAYLWKGNCLRPFSELSDKELELAERLLLAEQVSRQSSDGGGSAPPS